MLRAAPLTAVLTVTAALLASPVLAADPKMASADTDFVTKAAQAGMAEVKLGQLGAQKGQSDAVKQFGQAMVDDHTKANDELKQIAAPKSLALPTQPSSDQQKVYKKISGAAPKRFDRLFSDQMVDDHEKVVALFKKEASSGQDPDLKAFAAKTLPTLQEHLTHAKDLKGAKAAFQLSDVAYWVVNLH